MIAPLLMLGAAVLVGLAVVAAIQVRINSERKRETQ